MATRYEEHTPVDVLIPYEHNPRIITQAAVDAVARSVNAYGFNEPIIADENGVILAGHNRLKAAKQLGLTEVPVIWVDGIDEQRAKAFRIADNRTAEFSQWDRNLLDKELGSLLKDGETDFEAMGIEQWELDRLSKTDAPTADDGFLPEKAFKKKSAFEAADDEGEHVESAPKRTGKPLSPPCIRLLVIIETDEDQRAIRQALHLDDQAMIPAVIRFSEILKEMQP